MSKSDLKKLFKNGRKPTEKDFANLIDKTASQLEVQDIEFQIKDAIKNIGLAEGDGGIPKNYSSLKERLDKEQNSLLLKVSNITKMPEIRINKNVSIDSALPSTTLDEVKALDPSASTNDSADWYILQLFINECKAKKSKTIRIPEGTYYLSKGLNLSGLEYGCFIDCEGVIFKAVSKIDEIISIKHQGNYWKGRRVTIKGLEIRGEFLAQKGVCIDGVQEWLLQSMRIHGCFVGLSMADTWYGEISTETIIQDCLIGVDFAPGKTHEVNTIEFSNLKINFAVPKTSFYPIGEDESEASYDERIESIGITLGIILGGISFSGTTIEGTDYAFKYKAVVLGEGTQSGVFSIKDGYFEAIKKRFFDFSEAKKTGYLQAIYVIDISNNRFLQGKVFPSVFTEGRYRILNNQKLEVEFTHGNRLSRITAVIDGNVSVSKETTDSTQLFIRREGVSTDANAHKYRSYDNDSVYPHQISMLPTIQDNHGLEYTSRLKSNIRAYSPYVLGVHTKPLTFIGNEHPAAPVIKGDDDKFYMLSTKNGENLSLIEVKNFSFLESPEGSKTAKELYKRTSAEGDKAFCIEIESSLIYSEGKWKRGIGTPSETIAIGRSSDFVDLSTISASSYYTPTVWNVQINHGYVWQGDYWGWGNNVLGTGASNVRAVGSLSQRPSDPAIDRFIYYSTDDSKHYIWSVSENAYNDYTPIF